MIPLVTISTGTTSKWVFPLLLRFFKIPVEPNKINPPAAANESVQPGVGCKLELPIIEGRQITTFTFPFVLNRVFSARFFVKVYVFGKLPISYYSFCLTSAYGIFITRETKFSISISKS
jgi:hypothetical protein